MRDAATAPHVWWDNNKPMTPAHFDALLADFLAHAADKDLFVQDLVGGADETPAAADARRHRIRLAFAVHPQPADPAGREASSQASCRR